MLLFKIEELQNIPRMDVLTKSDVVCRLTFQGLTKMTMLKNNVTDVLYGDDAMFLFPLNKLSSQEILIELLDHDGFRFEVIDEMKIPLKLKKERHTEKMRFITFTIAEVETFTSCELGTLRHNVIGACVDKLRASISMNL